MAKEYTDKTIKTYQNLELVRVRPTAYLIDKGTAGMIHMLREIIDNSVDELVLRPEGGTIYICMFRDRVYNRFQIAILDDGRGIPANSLTNVTTVLGASGKSNAGTAYVASGGLFGFGFKVSAALSTRFRVISKNYLEKDVSSIYIQNGVVQDRKDMPGNVPSGVLTLVEPDLAYFNNETVFMESGYLDLISICQMLNVFNPNINFQFYIYDRRLPDSIWTEDALTALNHFRDLLTKKKQVEYDAAACPDKASYLLTIWHVDQLPIYADSYYKLPADGTDRLGFNIKLFFLKKSQTGRPKYFVAINNISIPDVINNSATGTFMEIFRKMVAANIEDPKYQKFVQEEYYFPTMLLALDIKYHNAELSGATKTSFHDQIFEKQFASDLTTLFRFKDVEYWKQIVSVLMPDIEYRYDQSHNTPIKKTDNRKIFMDLNFYNNYFDCIEHDPERSELYIVEGTSAGNIKDTRDKRYQAIYMTRGKPQNAASRFENLQEDRKVILKDPVYQDIFAILGVNPNFTTTPRVRFNKLIISTDADTDGAHIRVLHLNDLYIANPLFIESGFVWLANPPLYSISISKNNKLFLRDKTALMDARVKFIYEPTLQIKIQTPTGLITPTPETYRDLCYLVHYLGNQFELVARQLNIPLLILERLVYAVDALYPDVDYLKLAKYFQSSDQPGFIKVQSNQLGRYIVVSVGQEDYPIGLEAIGTLIVDHLLKLCIKYKYKDLLFKVTSLHRGSTLAKDQPMSMMMLYICMKQLDGLFKVHRYKGLGQLQPEDCRHSLMDPATRSITHVIDVGDARANYGLLGQDSTARKVLLSESGMLSTNLTQDLLD